MSWRGSSHLGGGGHGRTSGKRIATQSNKQFNRKNIKEYYFCVVWKNEDFKDHDSEKVEQEVTKEETSPTLC